MAFKNLKGFDIKAKELTFSLILPMQKRTKRNRTAVIILTKSSPVAKRMVVEFKIIMAELTGLNKNKSNTEWS